jgi:hypothetical protein
VEALWTNAVSVRAKLFLSEPYWNAQKEQAAFYARKGDFHAAAAIAQQVATGTAGKTLKPELPMPYLDSRPRAVVNQPQYSLYGIESNVAMSEILAMDKWRTDGPDAAAPRLKDLFLPQVRGTIDRGSDSERTQLFKWFEQRVFLHMSILLDGEPTQERIDKAYETLSQVKGAYLSALGTLTRIDETDRANPNNQLAQFLELDQLAKAREEHSHLFVEAALDGKAMDGVALAARENAEQVLASALLAGPSSSYAYSYFPRGGLAAAVPANSAFVDIVVWGAAIARGNGRRNGSTARSLCVRASRHAMCDWVRRMRSTRISTRCVQGLRAAFAMAGAESMVMTLWPVDDAAGRQFMKFFYAHVKDGPAEAVREAQEEMLTKTEYKSPSYWWVCGLWQPVARGDGRRQENAPAGGSSKAAGAGGVCDAELSGFCDEGCGNDGLQTGERDPGADWRRGVQELAGTGAGGLCVDDRERRGDSLEHECEWRASGLRS